MSFLAASLGKFTPTIYKETIIESELRQWSADIGIVAARLMTSKNTVPIGVRNPSDHIRISTTDKIVMQWHRDGLGEYALDCNKLPDVHWMILWSNGSPTELQDRNNNRIYFEPFDVILVNNYDVFHRCPPPEENRWFVRILDPILNDSVLSMS